MTDDWDALVAAAAAMTAGPRRLLGITGAPGAGKTVLAESLATRLDGRAVVVGMDGFHRRDTDLRRLGRLERKGAPDTFDAAGYVALLRRLSADAETEICAPRFDRGVEEPVPDAIVVPSAIPLVITEGNYLLLDDPPWDEIVGLLDECWYVDLDPDERRRRLHDRHVAYGRSSDQAAERTHGSDELNAVLIEAGRNRATRIVTVPTMTLDPRT